MKAVNNKLRKNMFKKTKIAVFLSLFAFMIACNMQPIFAAKADIKSNEEAVVESRYPDYAKQYIGNDKFEKFNRKMFNFNSKLNKYALRPVHVIWASIMPKYGMERIQNAYHNIEYPKRLVSSLLQRDFKAAGTETVRFLANSTIGLAGMYDPAKRFLKIESKEEDIDQALCKCKVKRGPYLVLPVINGTTPRALAGRAIETGLDPTTYVASPIAALVRMGIFINKTSFMQPLAVLLERTYADPYDITKKLYGLESYIKLANLDRKDVLARESEKIIEEVAVQSGKTLMASSNSQTSLLGVNTDDAAEQTEVSNDTIESKEVVGEFANGEPKENNDTEPDLLNVSGEGNAEKISSEEDEKITSDNEEKLAANEVLKGGTYTDDALMQEAIQSSNDLEPDIVLKDFKPQGPVVDSMRTALFDLPGIDESFWSELSIWNRSFSKRIRTAAISLSPEREKYKFRYIMQKDKSSPVAILYPSIGEGIMSHHSVVLAKLFYDAGYSVIIQGSHFQWQYLKSMPEGYRPGLPSEDAKTLQIATKKIIDKMEEKYDTKFSKKVLLGTSFGAMTTLFVAENENKEKMLDIDKYISINPPVELMFALKEIDKNNDEWNKNPSNLKHRTAVTAAKILSLVNQNNEQSDFKIETLPFSDYEGKLITSFILRQKLSDLVYTIENTKKTDKAELYKTINNMSFKDYAQKYLIKDETKTIDSLCYSASLHSISNYLKNNENYKIYHATDDYLANKNQLKKLRQYSGKKLILLSNGAHLGFLYRQEFIDNLKKEIALK